MWIVLHVVKGGMAAIEAHTIETEEVLYNSDWLVRARRVEGDSELMELTVDEGPTMEPRPIWVVGSLAYLATVLNALNR